MASPIRQLIPQLLANPRLEHLQLHLSQSLQAYLEAQGLRVQREASFELQDTGVGAMRKLVAQYVEPESGAVMQLLVVLLAKVDGSVQCWSELWCTSKAEVREEALARAARVGPSDRPAFPARIRLVRQNHFDTRVDSRWAAQSEPLAAACDQLDKRGLFSTSLTTADYVALAAALAP